MLIHTIKTSRDQLERLKNQKITSLPGLEVWNRRDVEQEIYSLKRIIEMLDEVLYCLRDNIDLKGRKND